MKAAQIFGKSLLLLFLCFTFLWLVGLTLLQTASGQKWALELAEAYFERETGIKIKSESTTFSFPLALKFEGLSFIKNGAVFLTVGDCDMRCQALSLLQGRVIVSHLAARDIDLLHLPFCWNGQSQDREPSPSWEKPPLPFYLRFANIDLESIKIAPAIAASVSLSDAMRSVVQDASFDIKGYVSNNPFKTAIATHLLFNAKNPHLPDTHLKLLIHTEKHQLSVAFHACHLPSDLLDLPLLSQGTLDISAEGDVSSWQNLIEKSDERTSSIDGHFKLTLDSCDPNALLPSSNRKKKQAMLRGYYALFSNRLKLLHFKVAHPLYSFSGKGSIASNGQIEEGVVMGKMPSLNRFNPSIGGEVAFDASFSGSISRPRVAASFKSQAISIDALVVNDVKIGLEAALSPNASEGTVSLAGKALSLPWEGEAAFSLQNENSIALLRMQIKGDGVQIAASGEGTAVPFAFKGVCEAKINDFHPLSPLLNGDIQGSGSASLSFSVSQMGVSTIEASAAGRAISYGGCSADALDLNLNLRSSDSSLFDLQGSIKAASVALFDTGTIEQLQAQFSNQFDLSTKEAALFSLQGEALNLKAFEAHAAQALFQGSFAHPTKSREGSCSLQFDDVKYLEMEIEKMSVSTALSGEEQWPYEIAANGIWKEDFAFASSGSWNLSDGALKIEAKQASGLLGPYPLAIASPFFFQKTKGSIRLEDLSLRFGEAQLQARLAIDEGKISAHLASNAIPSELFYFAAPNLPLSGRAAFEGELSGTLENPNGSLEIHLERVQIIEELFKTKPLMGGKISLLFKPDEVEINSALTGVGNVPVKIQGKIPVQFHLLPFAFSPELALPFSLNLEAEGELDPYLHLLYNDTTNLTGNSKIALEFNGSLNEPKVKGTIDLFNGAFESLNSGAVYQNIQAHLEGDGSRVMLTSFSAQSGKQGAITAAGEIKIDLKEKFPFAFEIQPSRIFLIDSDYLDIIVSGTLQLIGNTEKSKVQGVLTIDQGNLHLEEAIPQNIKRVDVQYVNIPEEDQQHFHRFEKPSSLELEVTLNASNSFVIEGKDLKSNWSGSIVATGTPNNLLLNGDLRLNQGQYHLKSKVFNLTQGNIHFAGPAEKKTTLYIVASKDIDKIKAEIILKGSVSKPAISFRSNPPLSQREILSYILFNRGISDITQDQGNQLSQSFISLNSTSQTASSDDFLSRLRNKIGIDSLDFTTGDTPYGNDLGLQVGKYITENIKVSVSQSMVNLIPVIAVEANVRKNIKIQAEAGVGQDAPIRTSIKWKKDY